MSSGTGDIVFTPLCVSTSTSSSCFLLQIEDCRILLDCGWDDGYDPESIKSLQEYLPFRPYYLVLLSHSDAAHLGALPYAFSKLGLRARILCTLPVSKMGQMFLYDLVLSLQAESEFNVFTLDEIDSAFSQVITLKYNEEFHIEEFGLVISARNAGHMVGGAAWVISKGMHNIVHLVDYNHKREKHLNGLRFESLKKPVVLITDSKHISQPAIQEEEQNIAFLSSIMQTLRNGGKVLIPTDTAGRVLELVLMLEEYWIKNKLTYPLILLGTVSYSTVHFASCQLEWMHASIASTFEKDRDNPFDCNSVQFCNGLDELEKIGDRPKVVLASSPSLETGFAKQLAVEWVQEPNNLILFTQDIKEGTLGQVFWDLQDESGTKETTVTVSERVPLVGKELEDYEDEKLRKLSESMISDQSKDENLYLQSDKMDISGFEEGGEAAGLTRGLSLQEGDEIEMKHYLVSGTLIDGFELSEATEFPMFPFDQDKEDDWDVFGEAFDESELFHLQSAKEDPSLLSGAPAVVDEEVPEVPSKIVSKEVEVEVKASIVKHDCSATTNGHFMRHFISSLRPQNLVLVNGSVESHQTMTEVARNGCSFLRDEGRVHCPGRDEKVEISGQLGCFGMVLDDALVQDIEWKKSATSEVVWIEGQLQVEEDDKREIKMVPLDSEVSKQTRLDGLFVGDCRLSTIKKEVESLGMKTTFHGGKLTCNGTVQIHITPQSAIAVEGPLCTDYYLIRQAVDGIYRLH